MRPLRFLTAIRFNYARELRVSVNEVNYVAEFYKTSEELESARKEGSLGFTKLVLLGAKWDFAE